MENQYAIASRICVRKLILIFPYLLYGKNCVHIYGKNCGIDLVFFVLISYAIMKSVKGKEEREMKQSDARQKALLNALLKSKDYKPVSYYAEQMRCSEKTVRNDLEALAQCGIQIKRVTGRGIRLIESEDDWQQKMPMEINEVMTTARRREKILFDLLKGKDENNSIQKFADRYWVSKTSITNDLLIIEKHLQEYGIGLLKDVHGTRIIGEETSIRKALADLINDFVDKKETLIERPYSHVEEDTLSELKKHFDEATINFVENLVYDAERYLGVEITEPYYINLVTHLLIAIDRIKTNQVIEEKEEVSNVNNRLFYKAAQIMACKVERKFSLTMNESEVLYIYRYLTSSGGISKRYKNDSEKHWDKAALLGTDIIESCQKIFPLKFSFSKQLYETLLLHIRPMLHRIEYGVGIKNPILDDFRKEFPDLMVLLNIIVVKLRIKYHLPEINEDEVGYLAVYFQNAIENVINHKRILIVCSSGIGTSHLLAKRIQKFFPDWEIVDIISTKHITEYLRNGNIDLIVATVRLNIAVDIPVVYVSAFFNEKDGKKITNMFKQTDATFAIKPIDSEKISEGNVPAGVSEKTLLISRKISNHIKLEDCFPRRLFEPLWIKGLCIYVCRYQKFRRMMI